MAQDSTRSETVATPEIIEIPPYPKTGQKFKVDGEQFKWVPYAKSVRKIYGEGRFQRMKWSGAKEDGDWFKWANDNPPAGKHWQLLKKVKGEDGVWRSEVTFCTIGDV